MLKNRCDNTGLVAAGVASLIAVWIALGALEHIAYFVPEPLGSVLVWSYGLALGAGGTSVYVASGGRSLQSAIFASMLGTVFVLCAAVIVILIGVANEMPLLGALFLPPLLLFLLLWGTPIAAILLLLPATLGSTAIFVSARVVCRSRW